MDYLDYRSLPDCRPMGRFYANFRGVFVVDNHFRVSAFHRISCCAVQALIVLSLVMVPALAVEGDSSEVDSSGVEEEVLSPDPGPSTVYVVSPDVDISGFLEAGPDAYEVFSVEPDSAPVPFAAGDDFPFYSSCWVKGTADGLGQVSLFFPINRQSGYGKCLITTRP